MKQIKRRLTENAKRLRFQWTEESMDATYTAVDQGTKTQRQAAKEFSVPQSTLQKLIDGKSHIGAKPAKKPLLENETETNGGLCCRLGCHGRWIRQEAVL